MGRGYPPRGRRKGLGAAGLVFVLVAVAAGAVYATIPSGNGTYTACYLKTTGAVRVIEASAVCKTTETRIQWSKTGPVGPRGPKGEASNEDPTLPVIGAMSVTGAGSNLQTVPIISVSHEIKSPRDSASGQATGKRQHGFHQDPQGVGRQHPDADAGFLRE